MMRKFLKVPSIPIQLMGAVVLAIVGAVAFGPLPALDYSMKQVGGIFMDALKMLVVPLAFVSITAATVQMGAERLCPGLRAHESHARRSL